MSKDLRIAVRREYFDQIADGSKPYEYRLQSEYWRKRLIGKSYDTVTITLGYPRADQSDRIMVFPYRGYIERIIKHKEFGPKEVDTFAIRVGK